MVCQGEVVQGPHRRGALQVGQHRRRDLGQGELHLLAPGIQNLDLFQVIVLERNRRVAKAYARAPVLTVNGANDGFDGFRIGVNGFENPMRDSKTRDCKGQIGAGCKLKMDDSGNILVKRLAKSAIYVKNTLEENSVSNDILKLPGGLLEQEKPFKLFDMKKFQQNVNRCLHLSWPCLTHCLRELKRPYPERAKLESQCISTLALVRGEAEVPLTKFKVDVLANTQFLGPRLPHLVDADQRGRPGDVEGEDAPVLVQVAPLQTHRLTLSTTPLSILPPVWQEVAKSC